MKSVVFRTLKIRNFLSVGDEPLELAFSTGVSLITGENRDKGGKNGVGKSLIGDALFWSIFSNTLRDIKKDQIIHDGAQSPCMVELNFDVIEHGIVTQYRLHRQMEPNSVILYKNEEDITLSSMPKTDNLIQNIIGANEEVFRNAIILSANNTLPFMAQGKTSKRKFVEGVLKLGIFGEMLLRVRLDHNDEKRNNDIISTKFTEKNKNLIIYQAQLTKNNTQRALKIKELEERVQENQKTIEKLVKDGAVDSKKEELAQNIASIELKIAKLERKNQEESLSFQEIVKTEHGKFLELQRLETDKKNHAEKTGACPTCKRDYSQEEEKVHLQKHLAELDAQIQNAKKEWETVKTQKEAAQDSQQLIQGALTKLRDMAKSSFEQQYALDASAEKINQLQEKNISIQTDIDTISKERDSMEDLIQNTQKERESTEATLKNIQKQLSILESAKFVVSEEGVKTYIIKKMLGLLNSRLNFYLQAMEAPCKCEFNEVFEETLINDLGKQKSYFNFSNGERLRIDMAILFMFQDILRIQNGVSYSLSIYDELLDSALDEKGISKILDILRSRVEQYNEAIYIISHNKSITGSNIDQTILLEKKNGCTRIVEN